MHAKLCVAFHRLRNILCAVSAENKSPHVREKIKRNNVRDGKTTYSVKGQHGHVNVFVYSIFTYHVLPKMRKMSPVLLI